MTSTVENARALADSTNALLEAAIRDEERENAQHHIDQAVAAVRRQYEARIAELENQVMVLRAG